MEKKKSCFYNFFSSSGNKALPQPYPENAPFLSNPDTGGVNSSSRLQRIPTSSYRVPMASTATEENAKVDLEGLITHISKLFEFKVKKNTAILTEYTCILILKYIAVDLH